MTDQNSPLQGNIELNIGGFKIRLDKLSNVGSVPPADITDQLSQAIFGSDSTRLPKNREEFEELEDEKNYLLKRLRKIHIRQQELS